MKQTFPNYLSRFQSYLQIDVFIFLITACLLFSCKKEDLKIFKYGPPDIIVHEGNSIQAAINKAENGAVIFIEPGTYNEAVTISKPGIKLVGKSIGDHVVILENPGDQNNGIRVTDEGMILH